MADNAWKRLGERLRQRVEDARMERMKRLGDPNSFPRMPEAEWRDQPEAVRTMVEEAAVERWRFTCRDTVARVNGVTDDLSPGWLNTYRGLYAEALDVPIGRLFTACAILHRSGGLREAVRDA